MASKPKPPAGGVENREVTRSCRLTNTEVDQLNRAAWLERMRPTHFMRDAIMAKVKRVLRREGEE